MWNQTFATILRVGRDLLSATAAGLWMIVSYPLRYGFRFLTQTKPGAIVLLCIIVVLIGLVDQDLGSAIGGTLLFIAVVGGACHYAFTKAPRR